MSVYEIIKPFLHIHAPYAQDMPWRNVSNPRLPCKALCKDIIFVPRPKHPEYVEIMQFLGPDYGSEMIIAHYTRRSLLFEDHWRVSDGNPPLALFDHGDVEPFVHTTCESYEKQNDPEIIAIMEQMRHNEEWNDTRIPLDQFICDLVTSMDQQHAKWLDRQQVH